MTMLGQAGRDDRWQRSVREALIVPHLDRLVSRGVIRAHRETTLDEQRQHVGDVVITLSDGRAVFREEKIVRWPGYAYDAYTLETWSNTGAEMLRFGWMHNPRWDELQYGCVQSNCDVRCECSTWCGDCWLVGHVMQAQPLAHWFWNNLHRWERTTTAQINRTECAKVPVLEISSYPWARTFRHHRDPARDAIACRRAGEFVIGAWPPGADLP